MISSQTDRPAPNRPELYVVVMPTLGSSGLHDDAAKRDNDLGTGLGDRWRDPQGHSGNLKDNGQKDRETA
jgi:hypothetical protein